MYKKTISIVVLIIFLISLVPTHSMAAATLPASFTSIDTINIGSAMPFKPPHKYVCRQNPPDFTWPQISGAVSYELGIFADANLSDLRYSKINIPNSYYSFTYGFEPGTYWWAVRYKNAKGEESLWSVPRRFTLDTNYHEFKVTTGEEIVNAIPKTHPRMWFTQDTIGDFKNHLRETHGYDIYTKMLNTFRPYLNSTLPNDPGNPTTANNYVQSWSLRAQMAALCYHLTDDESQKEQYLNFAVKVMKHFNSWKYDEPTDSTSFAAHDIAYFELMFRTAMTYDWLYNEMTSQDRDIIRNAIIGRFDYVKDRSLKSLRSEPYNSHIWSYFNAYGIACMALVHDEEWVNDYMVQMLDLQTPNFPPMSVEDGGWSKGTRYWAYGAFSRDKWFIDCLLYGGYMNYYDKMWAQNEALWALYMYPDNSYGSFGDGSNIQFPNYNHIIGLTKLGKNTDNEVAYWLRNKIGYLNAIQTQSFDAIMYADTFEKDGKAPNDLPLSHVFVDQGAVGMHSTITDSNRISLYFRSSKYGSYNHMHADQNSFIIEAYGERLATKSGFYDNYHSTHDKGFTRQTFAHNSVTYNGGYGQKDDLMNFNGNVDNFLTHFDFDLAVGDATRAYNGEIGKFVRSIIYLRPDSYIVVDDLEAKSGEKSTFEWWLNSPSNTMTVGGNTAIVKSGEVSLNANMVYPKNLSGVYMHNYVNPVDGKEYLPGDEYTDKEAQDRVYFVTDAVSDTKMVATMNVNTGSEKTFKCEKYTDYIKLTPEDNEDISVYIRVVKDGEVTTKDGITFNGIAAVVSSDTAMLVRGTSLIANKVSVFKSDKEISAILGKGQFGISGKDDFSAEVNFGSKYCPYFVSMSNIREKDGRLLSELITASGTIKTNILTLDAFKGHYMFTLNDLVPINPNELIPEICNITMENENTVLFSWNGNPKYKYDILINGTLFENATSPHRYTISTGETVTAHIRGKYKNIKSPWSDKEYFNPFSKPEVSYTDLILIGSEASEDGLSADSIVRSEVNINGGDFEKVNLVMAQYNPKGELVDLQITQKDYETREQAKAHVSTTITEDGNTVKSFIWNPVLAQPITPAAYFEDEARLAGISIDGVKLKDFKEDIYTYNVTLDETGQIPVVKGITDNNATYITTAYSNTDITAKAIVKVTSTSGNMVEYIVNFSLPEGTQNVVPLVSDFKNLVSGMSYEDYCAYAFDYLGKDYDNGFRIGEDTPRKSIYYIPDALKLETFTIGGKLCGRNTQRIVEFIEKRSGFENAFYVGPDPAMWQTSNMANWISSAYFAYDSSETMNGLTYKFDFEGCSVPWYSFKVNRDCKVIILSGDEPKFLKEDSSWENTWLTEYLYKARRVTTDTELVPYTNMYVKHFRAGDTVELFNSCSGTYSSMGYMTLIDFD